MKKTLILLLAALMLLWLAACDTESTNDSSFTDSVEASVEDVTSAEISVEEQTSEDVTLTLQSTAAMIPGTFGGGDAFAVNESTYKFNNAADLQSVKAKFYSCKSNSGLEEKLASYNNEFFSTKTLFVVYKTTRNCGFTYDIDSVKISNGILQISINDITPFGTSISESECGIMMFVELDNNDLTGVISVETNLQG